MIASQALHLKATLAADAAAENPIRNPWSMAVRLYLLLEEEATKEGNEFLAGIGRREAARCIERREADRK